LDEVDRLYEEVRSYAAPVQLEITPTDLSELWQTVWTHLNETHRAKSLKLIERVDGEIRRCGVDRHKIEQVIRNIFENAIAVSEQGGEIVVTCADADIDGRSGVRISIHDNGPGLDERQKQQIFNPFFTTKPKGTGLGMAIAKRLVEAHGGAIVVGDGSARGGEIVVSLPEQPR
jgi:two-component system sensor kinase FixL